jgi:hypothetical protein
MCTSTCTTTYSMILGGSCIVRQWKFNVPSALHEPHLYPRSITWTKRLSSTPTILFHL